MNDFRHPDNPEPFTDMTLERDTRLLEMRERSALRSGLAELSQAADRFFDDIPAMDRGSAASDLNRMMAILRRMRSALLEFPDKPNSLLPRFIDILRA